MLRVTRKRGEIVELSYPLVGVVTIEVLSTGGEVMLGIDAPQEVKIIRPDARRHEPRRRKSALTRIGRAA